MFGLVRSKFDGSEHVYAPKPKNNFPRSYSYADVLPKVVNQGSDPICLPCSVGAYVNWRINRQDGSKVDNKVDYWEIYNARALKMIDGMSIKEGMNYLMRHGVKTAKGKFRIKDCAVIRTPDALRMALLMNGPCVVALPVYQTNESFWLPMGGKSDKDMLGFHAVAVVGYDGEGFIIRNSWGTSYGRKGYSKLMYKDFGRFYEIWTMF